MTNTEPLKYLGGIKINGGGGFIYMKINASFLERQLSLRVDESPSHMPMS
jgi:hypothetical protein